MEKIDLNNKTVLVTGAAGFIGSNLVHRLFNDLKEGTIVGIDNLNNYYVPSLKIYCLDEMDKHKPSGFNYKSIRGSIADRELVNKLFEEYHFDIVVNLAAQVGVRYRLRTLMSISNPTSLASTTSSKPVATIPWSTWSMPVAPCVWRQ